MGTVNCVVQKTKRYTTPVVKKQEKPTVACYAVPVILVIFLLVSDDVYRVPLGIFNFLVGSPPNPVPSSPQFRKARMLVVTAG